jgi:hypothetical protein
MKTLNMQEMQRPTCEILSWAGQGIRPIELPSDTDPQRFDVVQQDVHLAAIEQRLEIEDIIAHTVVSEAVRKACERELFEGARRGWREI